MSESGIYEFDQLADADLIVDATYRGGTKGNSGDDPIARLVPVGNQGGFRRKKVGEATALIVLYTSGHNPDWPDYLDVETGRFVYFGDNRKPGHELHNTPRGGNVILRDVFADVHSQSGSLVPPFFIFEKAGTGRDVKFRGLAVPGSPQVGPDDDLVAIWRSTDGERFQNYRAIFTVLDVRAVSRAWINDVLEGNPHSDNAPQPWLDWLRRGRFEPLAAPRTVAVRTKAEQLPSDAVGREMLATIHRHFADNPTAFEPCAARLWEMIEPNAITVTITQASVDGGRDAVGRHALGPPTDRVVVDYALEAKCYQPDNGVGVKELSRLISRLLHRQYGVLVTTSYLGAQPYREVREDGHPVVIVAGRDIVDALKGNGLTTAEAVRGWLVENFKN